MAEFTQGSIVIESKLNLEKTSPLNIYEKGYDTSKNLDNQFVVYRC